MELPAYDEAHDPDLPGIGDHADEDATHVGASPGVVSPPAQQVVRVVDDQSNEIDIGDVLSDDDL